MLNARWWLHSLLLAEPLLHVCTESTGQLHAREREQLVEPRDYTERLLVGSAERLQSNCVPHADPVGAHVVEVPSTGLRILQVPDELRENPRLVGVGDSLVRLLQERLRVDPAPRQVIEVNLPKLPLVHRDWVNSGRRRNLVADRDDGIKALFACDVEVVVDLFGVQIVPPSLDLQECGPRLLPA